MLRGAFLSSSDEFVGPRTRKEKTTDQENEINKGDDYKKKHYVGNTIKPEHYLTISLLT